MTKTAEEKIIAPAANNPIKVGARSDVPFKRYPPKRLSNQEKSIWRGLSNDWSHVLTKPDESRFEKHVILESLFRDAYEKQDVGLMIKLIDRLERGYSVFGATPLARTKLPGIELPYRQVRNKGFGVLDEAMKNTGNAKPWDIDPGTLLN